MLADQASCIIDSAMPALAATEQARVGVHPMNSVESTPTERHPGKSRDRMDLETRVKMHR